jgi:hypothetical protein
MELCGTFHKISWNFVELFIQNPWNFVELLAIFCPEIFGHAHFFVRSFYGTLWNLATFGQKSPTFENKLGQKNTIKVP